MGRRERAWAQRGEIPAASAGMTDLILRGPGGCGVGAAETACGCEDRFRGEVTEERRGRAGKLGSG